MTKRGIARTHGQTLNRVIPREYRAWSAAKTRCYNPKQRSYAYYGARGIYMDDRWRDDYAAFLHDMGKCPPNYTIDRINPDGPYSPENCRWASRIDQINNTRRNHFLMYSGKVQTIAQWAKEIGMPIDTLKRRILRGWDTERALTEPLRKWPSQR